MTEIHADIGALKGLRDALARFRLEQRDAAARGNQEIEKTRASLEAKARRWQARLSSGGPRSLAATGPRRRRPRPGAGRRFRPARIQPRRWRLWLRAGLLRTRPRRRGGPGTSQARPGWQRRVIQEADAFRGAASRFRT